MQLSRRRIEQITLDRAARKAARLGALCIPRGEPVGAIYGGGVRPDPKTEAYRDPALLEMAKGRPCLLLVPGVCNHRLDTTVAAHSNWPEHAKGMGRKADDHFSAFACHACHSWLDSGPAPARHKRAAFMAAHARQVLAWRQIAADPGEPERFRKAAARALERLGATPMGDAS